MGLFGRWENKGEFQWLETLELFRCSKRENVVVVRLMWLYNLNNTLFLSICLEADIMRENSGDCNFRAIVFDYLHVGNGEGLL